MAATIGALNLPIFTEYGGKRIELGNIEVPISVTIGKQPQGGVLRGHIKLGEQE